MADRVIADAESPVLVSVVISTYNRARLLREAIESLWNQALSPDRFEIIVVDDGSTDGTEQMMGELVRRSPVRLVYHPRPSNQGVAAAMNAGIRLAKGEFIASTDSDCRADPEWLARGVAAFRPGVAFVTGPTLDKPEQPVKFFSQVNSGGLKDNLTYGTANAFYRRNTYLEMGGLDETLSFPSIVGSPCACADTDLAWRMKEKGYDNVFAPDVVVYHEVEQLTPFRWLVIPFRLFVVPALVKRHPHLRNPLLQRRLFFLAENPYLYLAVIGMVLAMTVHIGWLILALPYPYRLAKVLGGGFSPLRFPKMLAQLTLLSLRHAVCCAGLIYGSVRFRTVVL